MNTEEWKDVIGFEGRYQVSNLGRVKSLGNDKSRKEKILKPGKNRKGYLYVSLWANRKYKAVKVHRLVAQAFLENPKNLPQVNHKNERKTDNFVENLEWISHRDNQNYGTRNKRISEKLTNGKCAKPLFQYSLEGELIKKWPSTSEVERELGFSHGNISGCCTGRYKTSYGYVWKYKNV